jgi:hypothetical protein
MIVCSCNVFSDHQVRSVVAKETRRPRVSEFMPPSDAAPNAGAARTRSNGSWTKGPAPFMRTQACTNRPLKWIRRFALATDPQAPVIRP